MPARDLDLLLEAGRMASEMGLRFFGKNPQSWNKPADAGPVTEADLAIDAALRDMLCAARPDYGWLSEETEDDTARCAHEHAFIIDPIDGTRAFMEGSLDWGHSLAIARNGEITAAVVAMPRHEKVFSASINNGAFCNGEAMQCGQNIPDFLADATILATKATLRDPAWRGGTAPEFQRTYRSSLAYRLCLVGEGRFDAMISFRPTWEWDVAAGDLIAREAGAIVTDTRGNRLRFNQPKPQFCGIMASTKPLADQIQNQLAP